MNGIKSDLRKRKRTKKKKNIIKDLNKFINNNIYNNNIYILNTLYTYKRSYIFIIIIYI